MLEDGLLQRSYPIEGVMVELAPLLAGELEWEEIRAMLEARGHGEEDVEEALRRLMFLHAVEGAGDGLVAKLERVLRREETVPISILEGARFECQGSGGCCQGYMFGPLEDDDVERLERLGLPEAWPEVAAPYVEEHPAGKYLRRIGDRCVFLEGRRCGLHARFGAEAKPGFCQLFPLDSFATVEGIRVVDTGRCATFGVSARKGLPLVEDMERVRPLLRQPVLFHPVVIVDGWEWDYAIYLRFTTAATAMVRRKVGTASETLMAIGRCLDGLTVAMVRFSIEPGQPDAIVGAVLGMEPGVWHRPPRKEAEEAGAKAIVEVLREIGTRVAAALARSEAGDTSAERLRELVWLVTYAAGMIEAAEETRAAAATAAADAEVDEALRLSLRQQLFGRNALVDGHAGAGLMRIALIQLLALAGARTQAGDRAITAADLSHGHTLAVRGLKPGKLDEVLLEHEPRWRTMLDGLARAARVFGG
jgi:Fe-S-cluster containining protein